MLYTIQSDYLTVDIRDKGAELWSIRTKDGCEYLWQGDPKYWSDRALNLFPQIGLCTGGQYYLHGKTYSIDTHGFVKDTVLEVVKHTNNCLVLTFTDNEETYAAYPFHFRYTIVYELNGPLLSIVYEVDNLDSEEMYFSVGGHPGFNLPLEDGLRYEDYFLDFHEGATARRAECTVGDCLMLDKITDYPIPQGRIPLSHGLFAERVLILTDMPHEVTLHAERGRKQVTVRYPDMKYLGVWKWLATDAPYVCIEPWSGLPARKNIVETYETHPDMLHLQPGGHYQNHWEIQIV